MNKSIISCKHLERHSFSWHAIIFVFIAIRFSLVDRISPYVMPSSVHDDAWCVIRAKAILSGQWLGNYDQYTLIKGAFSPLLMAFCQISGITYMHLNTLLYCFSCLVFMKSISPTLRKRISWLFCFVIILFNPISYALMTWQRVYRNGLSQWQVLLILGSFIAIYQNKKEGWKTLLPWSLLAGASLWSFMNTREDSIWILPFVVCAIGTTVVSVWLEENRLQWKRSILFLLPIVLLLSGNAVVSFLNYRYYGVFLSNDRTKGNYAKVVQDLYMIAPEEEDKARFSTEAYQDQYLNIYTSTVKKAYNASPTLASVSNSIDSAIKRWDDAEEVVDGEPYLDHILFAIRDGVAEAGYYTDLRYTETFYGKVHQELQEAFRNGMLKKRRALSFSAGAAPLKWEDVPRVLQELEKTIQFCLSFETVATNPIVAEGNAEMIALFEEISGDRAIYIMPDKIILSGWAFAYETERDVLISVCTREGLNVANAKFFESTDVYDYFHENGKDYPNAKSARFSIEVEGYDSFENLILRFYDQNNRIYSEQSIENLSVNCGYFEDNICYFVEYIDSGSPSLTDLELENEYVNAEKLNGITYVYRRLTGIVFVLSLCAYLYCTVQRRMVKKLDSALNAVWLLETGILLSGLLFAGCIAYMTTTTFYACQYLYLSPLYVMELAFCGLSIPFTIELMFKSSNRKKKRTRE